MPAHFPAVLDIPSGRVARGVVRVPGSKSLTQRALVISALARGRSVLAGASDSDDSHILRRALKRLGVEVREGRTGWVVRGTGGELRAVRAALQTENAGTAMRFLTALVALGQGRYVLDGSARMRERPIGDLVSALQQLGVEARCLGRHGCPPVEVQGSGSLPGGTTLLSGTSSSQYLSALLMVAPLARRGVTVRLRGGLVSAPYVALTLQLMRAFGARVRSSAIRKRRVYRIPGAQTYRPRRFVIEGDASSATYFLAAAAVTGGRVRVANLQPDSAQGDARFADLLERMGCRVRRTRAGVVAAAPADGALKGIDADLADLPDAVPTLAVVALFARSPTRIRGAAHLRLKETDRLRALAQEISRLGGSCLETRDGLLIVPRSLRPAVTRTYDDHRMAMAFTLVGLRVPGVRIQNPSCVRKSFPDYFARLLRLLR